MKVRTSARQIAGVIISLAGVLAIISRGNAIALMNFNLNQGDAIIAFAVLLWSIYTLTLRHRPAVHPLSFLAATLVISVVVIVPF